MGYFCPPIEVFFVPGQTRSLSTLAIVADTHARLMGSTISLLTSPAHEISLSTLIIQLHFPSLCSLIMAFVPCALSPLPSNYLPSFPFFRKKLLLSSPRLQMFSFNPRRFRNQQMANADPEQLEFNGGSSQKETRGFYALEL